MCSPREPFVSTTAGNWTAQLPSVRTRSHHVLAQGTAGPSSCVPGCRRPERSASLDHRRNRSCRHTDRVSEEREILTYEDVGVACRDLAQAVVDDGYRPDMIVSIARGGPGLGMGLGYALGMKNLSVINVEFYTGIDERLDVPVMLPPTPQAVDLSGLKVLIADDVADTGRTLEIVRDFCADHVAEARIAVIYDKPRSSVRPDYAWRRTDAWIEFPWSLEPPVTPGHGGTATQPRAG